MTDVEHAIVRSYRDEWTRIVAIVARRFGNLDIAEEAAGDAFAIAVERWRRDGIPPNPGGWLTRTAMRRAIDAVRRETRRDDKHRDALLIADVEPAAPVGVIDDDRLRLLFICCHPVLPIPSRVALTLRMVGGLTVPEIARAFLVQDDTMRRRITRAKTAISQAGVPFAMPSKHDLSERLSGVLAVLFQVFNEGYLSTGTEAAPIRDDLTAEAIRLARLVRELMPHDGEATGLLAMMLLIDARRPARVSPDGALVTLDEQHRSRWNRMLIDEGHSLVRERLATGAAPGRYQLLAAINAVHTSAHDARDTDWGQIVALYDQLVALDPSAIVQLNRAVAVAEVGGTDAALAILDDLAAHLDDYHAFHATRADLLRRSGRSAEARDAYDRAIRLAGNTAESALLRRRRDRCGGE